jgi:hypothetical protein
MFGPCLRRLRSRPPKAARLTRRSATGTLPVCLVRFELKACCRNDCWTDQGLVCVLLLVATCPLSAGVEDTAKWDRFVTKLGFRFQQNVVCENGAERTLAKELPVAVAKDFFEDPWVHWWTVRWTKTIRSSPVALARLSLNSSIAKWYWSLSITAISSWACRSCICYCRRALPFMRLGTCYVFMRRSSSV